MFLRQFSKLLVKHDRSLYVKPFLNTKNEFFLLLRSATTVHSDTASIDMVPKTRSHYLQYALNNADKYCIYNAECPSSMEDNFEALQMLRDSNPEDINIGQINTCLQSEISNYSLNEIYEVIILMAKKKLKKQQISGIISCLSSELKGRQLSDQDVWKLMFIIKEHDSRLFYHSQFKFAWTTFSRFISNIDRLGTEQIVLLFLCMIKFPKSFVQHVNFHVQTTLAEKIQQFNAEELGIIASGLLRGCFGLSHPDLPVCILNRALETMENMSDVAFSSICVLFNRKIGSKNANILCTFQEKMIPHIQRFNNKSKVNAALVGTGIRYLNPNLWDILADDFKKNIDAYDVKEIERMVTATTELNIQDNELLNLAIQQMESRVDPDKHRSILISFLHSLTLHKLYPEKLLAMLFSENFISEFLSELTMNSAVKYCFINCCIEIEVPEHNLHLIPREKRRRIFKVFKIQGCNSPPLSRCYYSQRDVIKVLKEMYGENFAQTTICLPHFEPGVLMRFDTTLRPLSVEHYTDGQCYANEAVNDDNTSLFLALVPQKDFLFGTDTPCLFQKTRMRQLKALGYETVLIKHNDWLVQKDEERPIFLKGIIADALKEKNNENTLFPT